MFPANIKCDAMKCPKYREKKNNNNIILIDQHLKVLNKIKLLEFHKNFKYISKNILIYVLSELAVVFVFILNHYFC